MKLLIISPALISSKTVSATSEITSMLRTYCLRMLPEEPRAPSALSVSLRSGLDACSAGIRPKIKPVSTETSKCEAEHAGVNVDFAQARNVCRIDCDEQFDSTECEQQSQYAADERKQNAFRQQLPYQPDSPAPRAMRTAISFCLAAARASRRLATFSNTYASRRDNNMTMYC